MSSSFNSRQQEMKRQQDAFHRSSRDAWRRLSEQQQQFQRQQQQFQRQMQQARLKGQPSPPASTYPVRRIDDRAGGGDMAHETIRGKVYDLQIRYELNVRGFAVSFRLAVAQNVPPIQVMMRGMLIEGSINDGDVVEVAGSRHNGILWARSVTNVATGATTTASYNPVMGLQRGNKASVSVYYIMLILFIPFILFVIALLAWGFTQAINNGLFH